MKRQSVAIVGAGRLGTALGSELHAAGYPLTEIVTHRTIGSRFPNLARSTGARGVVLRTAKLDAEIVWLCVPDSQIAKIAAQLSERDWAGKIAFHSSGVLSSEVLRTLKRQGARVASVHPLMSFIKEAPPALRGVSFAIEGDVSAVKTAFAMVRALKGNPVRMRKQDKPAYHAFATIVCPLLVALLASAEETARLAGVPSREARKRMQPIVIQTISNYFNFGAAKSFTGPIVRGDAESVRCHLEALANIPVVQRAYAALAKASMKLLPCCNGSELRKVLTRASTRL